MLNRGFYLSKTEKAKGPEYQSEPFIKNFFKVFMGINLIGRYRIDKANLQKSDLHLVIATRKPAPNKPNFYLLQRIGSQHRHISGLFASKITPGSPQEAQIFDFDYQGGYYVLKIDQSTGQAEIDFKSKKAIPEGSRVI